MKLVNPALTAPFMHFPFGKCSDYRGQSQPIPLYTIVSFNTKYLVVYYLSEQAKLHSGIGLTLQLSVRGTWFYEHPYGPDRDILFLLLINVLIESRFG